MVCKALRLPRVNLLIADDVGLGKTVEAGLVARELLLRRRIDLIVISAPPARIVQWKDELESKFSLTFDIIDRERVGELRRQRGFSVIHGQPARAFSSRTACSPMKFTFLGCATSSANSTHARCSFSTKPTTRRRLAEHATLNESWRGVPFLIWRTVERLKRAWDSACPIRGFSASHRRLPDLRRPDGAVGFRARDDSPARTSMMPSMSS
jgi:hypothetical protein